MFAVRVLSLVLVIGAGFSYPQDVRRVESPDGSSDIDVKIPLNGKAGDDNLLSAVGAVDGLQESGFGSATGGVKLENIAGQGHSLSILEKHTPSLSDQLTAEGSLNLLDKGPHKLDTNAFITRTIPKSDPSYTSGGADINYNYGDKGSLSLSGVHNPSGDQLKAAGSLKLHEGPHRLDANAFISKDMPKNSPSFTNADGSILYNYGNKGSLSLSGVHNPSGDQLKAAGSLNLLDKGPHKLDANAFISRDMPRSSSSFTSGEGSLLYNYGAGKGTLSLSGLHNPSEDQLSAAGSLNLLDKGPHRLDANAFVTRHIPVNRDPFTTGGGSLGYKYGDRLGATLSGSNLGYSAMADANLMRGRDYSLDLSGGVSKSFGPYMPETGWQPTGLITFRKSW